LQRLSMDLHSVRDHSPLRRERERKEPHDSTSSRRELISQRLVGAGTTLASAAVGWHVLTLPKEACASSVLCDETVAILRDRQTGREVVLVGTAHISTVSANLVKSIIDETRPTAVFVELDKSRFRLPDGNDAAPQVGSARPGWLQAMGQLRNIILRPDVSWSDKWRDVNAAVIGYAIGNLYQTIAKQGFKPGEEFLVAALEADRLNAELILGDRPVRTTLRRLSDALNSIGLNDLLKRLETIEFSPRVMDALTEAGVGDPNDIDQLTPEQLRSLVEVIKQPAVAEEMFESFKDALPEVYTVMIQERDEYMAARIRESDQPRMVAVVGLGHMKGIIKNLGYETVSCTSLTRRRQEEELLVPVN